MKLKEYIEKSFRRSGKKHLFITGCKQTGKTTVFNLLLEGKRNYGGLITYAVRRGTETPECILLQDARNAAIHAVVGIRNVQGTGMDPVSEGFEIVGTRILDCCLKSTNELVVIDEIGHLESNSSHFCDRIRACLQEKTVIAVLRKQSSPFLEELIRRSDIYLFDLDNQKIDLAVK